MKELETKRLILREWKLSDSKAMYEYAKNELVGPSAGWSPHVNEEESKEIIQMFIDNQDNWALIFKEDKKVIGSIGLHNRSPLDGESDLKQREIGYVLSPKYWGMGIMPEAVEEIIRYSFEELGLDLIWCGHYDFNSNSRRVIEKTGFKYRFTKERILERLNNRKVDTLYYSIIKAEYILNRG